MRFNEAFHQSDIQLYKRCPQAFKYARLLGEEATYTSVPMVHGTAIHDMLYIIHRDGLFDSTEDELRKLYLNCLYTAEFEEDRSPVKWFDRETEIAKLTEQTVIIAKNYVSKKFNRDCKVLEGEKEFKCKIGRYNFEGRIDQVRQYKDEIYLIDFKSGITQAPSEWNMKLNYQFGLYSVACMDNFGYMPKYVGYYRLKDHLPYEKTTWITPQSLFNKHTSWLEWFDTQNLPNVEQYEELTGKKSRKTDRDEVCFMPGDERGPGLYITKFTKEIAENIKRDIIRVCAAIRRNEFYRNDNSCNMCRFRDPCELELNMAHAIDKTEAVTGW